MAKCTLEQRRKSMVITWLYIYCTQTINLIFIEYQEILEEIISNDQENPKYR